MNDVLLKQGTPAAAVGNRRNYGVDLLRIVAMFYVIVLHVLGRGGALAASDSGSSQYAVSWLMET